MNAMAVALLKYALTNNLHVAALLIIIIGLGIYALFKFKLSEQSTGFKFSFIGEKLNTIDGKVDGIIATVADHSDKIIKLETVQKDLGYQLEEKFKRENEGKINAS